MGQVHLDLREFPSQTKHIPVDPGAYCPIKSRSAGRFHSVDYWTGCSWLPILSFQMPSLHHKMQILNICPQTYPSRSKSNQIQKCRQVSLWIIGQAVTDYLSLVPRCHPYITKHKSCNSISTPSGWSSFPGNTWSRGGGTSCRSYTSCATSSISLMLD